MAARPAFVVSRLFAWGGMQRTLVNIARECGRRGHEPVIFAGELDAAVGDDLDVRRLPVRGLSNHRRNDHLASVFAAVTARERYACRVGFTKLPGLDVYYAGDPCYMARTASNKSRWYRVMPRYRAFCRQEASVFRHGAGVDILLPAHLEMERYIRCYETETARFHLLPPGIQTARLSRQDDWTAERAMALRAGFAIGSEDHMLLCVGSSFRTKGIDRLIAALKFLTSALKARTHLVVVGDDEPRRYRSMAARAGLQKQVHFAGAQDEVAGFYSSADLLVHAPYTENTGSVLIEAMYCGLPVLVTDNCGYAGHVDDAGAGEVYRGAFDGARFASDIERMLQSPKREQWSRSGRDWCRTHDISGLVAQAVDVIEQRMERSSDCA